MRRHGIAPASGALALTGMSSAPPAIVVDDPPAPAAPAPEPARPTEAVAQVAPPVQADDAIPVESLIRSGDDQPGRPAS